MAIATGMRLTDLVQRDMVHRAVYTDPVVFAEEMRLIYARTWVYLAHESEVPNPGDYKTDETAGQPIVIVRHTDGQVHILFNRCLHRGATVCILPEGNSKF